MARKHKKLILSKEEYAIFMHEVNTYYGKWVKSRILCKCIGSYFYVFDNLEFNEYNVFRKLEIAENQFRIKLSLEELTYG